MLLRKRGTLKGDAATHRYRKTQENSMHSHVHPFFGLKVRSSARKVLRPTIEISPTREGSRRTTTCEGPGGDAQCALELADEPRNRSNVVPDACKSRDELQETKNPLRESS